MASPALFLRLLGEEDKGAALLDVVRSVAVAVADPRVFEVDPASFEQVPGAPFAYWVGEQIRKSFRSLSPLEVEKRYARIGLSTSDDFRFVRLWWEINRPIASVTMLQSHWRPFAKGGAHARKYADVHLVVSWANNAAELKAWVVANPTDPGTTHWSRRIANSEFFGRPGLTWPLRTTSGLALRAMPRGCNFGHKGPAAFVDGDDPQALLALLALANSAPFAALVALQLAAADAAARSYEVGVIQRTPIPELRELDTERLGDLAGRAWSLNRQLDTSTRTSHAFVLPALLQVEGTNLAARAVAWAMRVQQTGQALAEIESEIDDRCFDLYGFDAADRAAALEASSVRTADPTAGSESDAIDDEDESETPAADARALAAELFDWLVGVAFGRFDLRLATGERVAPAEPDPFDPLPVCSPGMLTGEDGLPLAKAPPGYPLAFPADGILVDDGDEPLGSARNDPIARIRSVLGILAAKMESEAGPGLAAETLEADLCRLLGVKTLRDWLRRPAGFFADHLGRWSKSRRKAPIYWPLSTESGTYTLWVYYPRLTDQTLYTCVNDHIDPKLKEIAADLERLRGNGEMAAKARKRADALLELQREIQALREELLRVAPRYKPDQNDGVLITAAPLRHLFRHKPWQKELVKCWDTLAVGGYDWSHLALALWPERVRALSKTDKSVAIAHGLEDLYEG